MGGEAWLAAAGALAARPWLVAAFVGGTAATVWLQGAFGGREDLVGVVAGDLGPSLGGLLLAATLMVAVHRAVLLGETRSPPPWRAPGTHAAFMGIMLALGILESGLAELIGRAGTDWRGLLADAALLLAAVYGAARLLLLMPTVALMGPVGWPVLSGAWALSRGRVAAMVGTTIVTGAPLLGMAVLLLLVGPSLPDMLLSLPLLALSFAASLAMVLALSAALTSLFFLACAPRAS